MSYWAKRMAKSQDKVSQKNIKEIEKQLVKYYGDTAKKVIADFEATYNKILTTKEDGKEPTPADLYKLDKYWEMQAQMREELRKLGEKQVSALTKRFEIQFFDVYYSMEINGLSTYSTIDNNIVKQMINQIWVADGKSWSQRIWGNTESLAATLNEELIHCVVSGKKTSDLKKVLQNRFNVSYNNADMLVRTEMAHIQTQAAQKRYEDYGVEEVEVFVDEDERTCPVCAKHEGERYPVYAKMPVPFHPRCRCCMIPVIDNNKERKEDKVMERKPYELTEKEKGQLERVYNEHFEKRELIYTDNKSITIYEDWIKEAQKALDGEKSIEKFARSMNLGYWDVEKRQRVLPTDLEQAVKAFQEKTRKEIETFKEKEDKRNYEIWNSYIYCEDCGKPIHKEGHTTSAQKRCPECQAKYRKKYKAQKEKERRAKKKN